MKTELILAVTSSNLLGCLMNYKDTPDGHLLNQIPVVNGMLFHHHTGNFEKLLTSQDFLKHTHYAPRYLLETTSHVRQILPYIVLRQRNGGQDYLFVYRRSAKVGEPLLSNFSSVGVGGHIDFDNEHYQQTAGDGFVVGAIKSSAMRELNEECVFVSRETGERVSLTIDPDSLIPNTIYFGDENNVGQRHVMFTTIIDIPEDVDVKISEDELINVGFTPISKLIDELHQPEEHSFEFWSEVIIRKYNEIN